MFRTTTCCRHKYCGFLYRIQALHFFCKGTQSHSFLLISCFSHFQSGPPSISIHISILITLVPLHYPGPMLLSPLHNPANIPLLLMAFTESLTVLSMILKESLPIPLIVLSRAPRDDTGLDRWLKKFFKLRSLKCLLLSSHQLPLVTKSYIIHLQDCLTIPWLRLTQLLSWLAPTLTLSWTWLLFCMISSVQFPHCSCAVPDIPLMGQSWGSQPGNSFQWVH